MDAERNAVVLVADVSSGRGEQNFAAFVSSGPLLRALGAAAARPAARCPG
jgi:hypothetical protein